MYVKLCNNAKRVKQWLVIVHYNLQLILQQMLCFQICYSNVSGLSIFRFVLHVLTVLPDKHH